MPSRNSHVGHDLAPHAASLLRRDVLQIGALSALGLAGSQIADLRNASAESPARPKGKASNCILIWLDGGPSHLETFDLKPDAPAEVRGPLESIQTSIPSYQISECLPKLASRLNHAAVIRSMTSPLGEHNFGTHYLLTGYKPTPVLTYPAFSSVAAHLHQSQSASQGVLPPHIAVPTARVGGGKYRLNGYLPDRSAPFSIDSDPSKPNFQVKGLDTSLDGGRLQRRQAFINRLDQFLAEDRNLDDASNPAFQQAFELLQSKEAKAAFKLEDESPRDRQRYGRKSIGQSCLLARRLVERGVPFVTVNNRGWDTHQDLVNRLKLGFSGAKTPVGLIPSLDLAVSALIDDLSERGLLDETLIVVMGEFGRTPKLNTRGGRDHWPRVFSVMLAGGGVRGGQVIGESDTSAESPKSNPVTPSDLVATIYALMGIDPKLELKTQDGRPVTLTPHDARIVSELTS